jgi:uncharacterized protein
MKIAIIGGGISGLSAAWHLHESHDVWLFEAQGRLGGHTDTHNVLDGGRALAIDTGFIVYNETNYPQLTRWFETLGVESQPTDMSFSVRNDATRLEYGTDSLRALFCQPHNVLRPSFLAMLGELRQFYRSAPVVLANDDGRSLAQYLADEGYGTPFIRDHLLPMCAAIWSQPAAQVLQMPIDHLVAFLMNHRLIQVYDRPQWRVVRGGSARYVDAFRAAFRGRVCLRSPARAIRRQNGLIYITDGTATETFDAVVLACHSDEALRLLTDADDDESGVLGSIRYHGNRALLHSDDRVMPRRRRAWSSWNAQVADDPGASVSVSYWMNRLQQLPGERQFFVTLNPPPEFAPDTVWAERHYRHPMLDTAAADAQRRLPRLQGRRNTWYCGAWCGWGFHEDGFVSGQAAAHAIQARRLPARAA